MTRRPWGEGSGRQVKEKREGLGRWTDEGLLQLASQGRRGAELMIEVTERQPIAMDLGINQL